LRLCDRATGAGNDEIPISTESEVRIGQPAHTFPSPVGHRLISRKQLDRRMSEPVPPESTRPPVRGCNLDLREEARQFFRQRIRVTGIGVILGIAFIAIGTYEVGLRASSGFSADYLIALLLGVLGLGLIAVSYYSGLLNPVTRIRGSASGVTFERRWGRPLAWSWKDPGFRLDIDDRTSDPEGTAESHQHLFFEGPGSIYGNLTPATIGPLLDTARTYNAPISTKQLEQRERGKIHLIRRIRIRPAPIR
jgi:hypothetical protein